MSAKRLFFAGTCLSPFFVLSASIPFRWNSAYATSLNSLRPTLRILCSTSSASESYRGESGALGSSEFKRWRNGGGWVHMLAKMEPSVVVEIGAIVHSECILEADVHLSSGAVIGPCVKIGQSTKVGYNASVSNCSVGDFCVIHNNVSIGQDGFGFYMDEGRMLKKPQLLHARIGNHVEVGASTCIDRGSWRDTTIGDHSKIDNLVQIGHNVVIGSCCLLCGQVGIAGSATIGDYVTLGGRACVKDHVSIASKVRLAANSCVTKDILVPGDYGGFPAVPIHEWRQHVAESRLLSKMNQAKKRVK